MDESHQEPHGCEFKIFVGFIVRPITIDMRRFESSGMKILSVNLSRQKASHSEVMRIAKKIS